MSEWINIEDHVNQIGKNESWAEDDDETQNDKPTFNWQKPDEETKPMSILEIAEEEEKRRKAEAAKPQKKAPPPKSTAPTSSANYTSSNRFDRQDRPPRNPPSSEPRELPTQPPFTAFVGNLPYSVSEEDMRELFSEVKSVRLIKDTETNKGKGYGYIEFESVDALSRALLKRGEQYHERSLNVDIAKPQSNESRKPTWGSSGTSFGDRDRDRDRPRNSNNQWGPSDRNTSSFGERRERNSSFENRRPQSQQQSSQPPVKRAPGEDPFGSAKTDTKRLDEIAAERLQRDLEREKEKKKRMDELNEERARAREKEKEKDRKPPTTSTTQTGSWRNHGKPVSPRTTEGFSSFAKSPRNSTTTHSNTNSNYQASDNEGFRTKQNNRPYEASGTGSAARASEAHANAKQTRTIIKKEDPQKNEEKKSSTNNPYSLLGEEDLV